jgi:hypothetical protein
MSLLEGLLAGIIIILIIIMAIHRHKHKNTFANRSDGVDWIGHADAEEQHKLKHFKCRCKKCVEPGQKAIDEHAEYFDDPNGTVDIKTTLGNCDDRITYTTGSNGGRFDFKDYAMNLAVDPQIYKNHAEFVKDRYNTTTQNITGRTWSPQLQLTDIQQMPWVGLRPPQAIAAGSYGFPDQVADLDYDWFSKKPKFTWSSSESKS